MADVAVGLYVAGWIFPLIALLATFALTGSSRLRLTLLTNAAASAAVFTTLFLVLVVWDAGNAPITLFDGPGPGQLVELTTLSAPLFPMAAILWLAGLAVAPTRTFGPSAARRSVVSFACIIAAFSTTSPVWLVAMLGVGGLVFVAEHRGVPRVAKVAGLYLTVSVALLCLGVAADESSTLVSASSWLIAGGLLIRKGIVPLHSWMPDSFDFGHVVPALLFNAPQLGAYATVVLLVPSAPGTVLTVVTALSLVTAFYGATLAVAESDTRRSFGYLFVAQSALVLAGLASREQGALAGGLAVWVASSLSLCGMGLVITALELRRGRLSLRDHHGGYDQMPLLGLSFLVFGLASVGFPGTLGFLGEELLLGGTIDRFPVLGFVAVAATAINGITVMRMYFSLFCGRRASGLPLTLRPRELGVFITFAAVLIASGLAPKYMVESRLDAAAAVISQSRSP